MVHALHVHQLSLSRPVVPEVEQDVVESLPLCLLDFRVRQAKLTQLDDLHALLLGHNEVGTRKVRTRSQEEHQAVAQVLTDLQAMRAEAERQVD